MCPLELKVSCLCRSATWPLSPTPTLVVSCSLSASEDWTRIFPPPVCGPSSAYTGFPCLPPARPSVLRPWPPVSSRATGRRPCCGEGLRPAGLHPGERTQHWRLVPTEGWLFSCHENLSRVCGVLRGASLTPAAPSLGSPTALLAALRSSLNSGLAHPLVPAHPPSSHLDVVGLTRRHVEVSFSPHLLL